MLEELFPEMIRLTLGPRQHGNRQHIIVPSLILDADHQPGAYPGGGSDYVVALEETSDFVGAISANRDIYFKSWSNVTSAINKSETEQRPILLAVFTTFHPNLNQIFSTAMNTRERLVISILSFLRRQGHIVNTTNLVSYAHLFERDVGKSKIPVCSDKNYNDLQCSRHKAVNILVHVGDLAAKVVFPTRRTMTHVYRRSVFCPIPPGDVPHGSRFFHAALSGCIPVVLTFEASIKGQISWHMDKGAPFTDCYPFSDRIDYTKIVIEIPGHRIDEITEILQDVPYEVILEKQKNLQLIRNFFIHDYSGVHSDTYSYLLAQILANL